MTDKQKTTDFGYEDVPLEEKVERVKGVFDSVAPKYDVMNDLMSFGVHRIWKRQAIKMLQVQPDHQILDLAGGSGDLTLLMAPKLSGAGHITLGDINENMLAQAKNRLLDAGITNKVDIQTCNAEKLPFTDNQFDRMIIGFGLRNVTDKQQALNEMYRTLKPGGRCMVLEFSTPTLPGVKPVYDFYSFNILPKIGKWVAKDEDSYRYLAESIRKHPDQETLKNMMQQAGFDEVRYHNLSGGIVAIHVGIKY